MADDENEPGSPRARPRRTEVQAEDLTTSPSRPKSATADASTFLIGAYAKYDRPYVWLREGGGIRSDGTGADDLPLDLDTLRVNARSGEPAGFSARVWDVAEELVGMNVFPTPPNTFAVDHGAIKRMEAGERFLAAGAMVGFLHDILEAGARRGGSGAAEVARRNKSRECRVHESEKSHLTGAGFTAVVALSSFGKGLIGMCLPALLPSLRL